MKVRRFSINKEGRLYPTLDGEYVRYEDYRMTEDYANRLVELESLPCLPKDLEILRESNTEFASANFELHAAIDQLNGLIEKYKSDHTREIIEYQNEIQLLNELIIGIKADHANEIVGLKNKYQYAVTAAAKAELINEGHRFRDGKSIEEHFFPLPMGSRRQI